VALATALALGWALGLPLRDPTRRSWIAFGQYFSINWLRWHPANLSPWADWPTILQQAFGPVASPLEALRARPALFARHVFSNAAHWPLELATIGAKLALPWRMMTARGWRGVPTALAVAGFYGLLAWRCLARHRARRREWLPWAALLAPGLAGCLLVYPQRGYLLIQAPLIGAWALAWLAGDDGHSYSLAPRRRVSQGRRAIEAVAAGVLLVAATPRAADMAPAQVVLRRTVESLRALRLPAGARVLEAQGGLPYYLTPPGELVPQYRKDAPAPEFLRRERVAVVIVSPELMADSRWRDDPQWRALLADPRAQGFELLRSTDGGFPLLVRRDRF
jgi:hypothetical protein